MNWKPIDDKAKDGRYVLLYQKTYFWGKEIERYAVGHWSRPVLGSKNWFAHNGYPCNVYPSHYCELSSPEE